MNQPDATMICHQALLATAGGAAGVTPGISVLDQDGYETMSVFVSVREAGGDLDVPVADAALAVRGYLRAGPWSRAGGPGLWCARVTPGPEPERGPDRVSPAVPCGHCGGTGRVPAAR